MKTQKKITTQALPHGAANPAANDKNKPSTGGVLAAALCSASDSVSDKQGSGFVGECLDPKFIEELFEYSDQRKAPKGNIHRIVRSEKHPTDKNKEILTVETMTGPRGLLSLFYGDELRQEMAEAK